MRAIRLVCGIVVAIIASVSVACSNDTPHTANTATSVDPVPIPVETEVEADPLPQLLPAPGAIDDVVAGTNEYGNRPAFVCRAGLTTASLPAHIWMYEKLDLGDTFVKVTPSTAKEAGSYTFEPPITGVRAVFIETRAKGTVVKAATPKPGFLESKSGYRYFTADWQPNMNRGFSVDDERFGNGNNSLESVKLCLE